MSEIKNKLNLNQILEEIKLHPDIAPLIKNGQTVEYSAHLIPETGYNKMPKLTFGIFSLPSLTYLKKKVHPELTVQKTKTTENFSVVKCLSFQQITPGS